KVPGTGSTMQKENTAMTTSAVRTADQTATSSDLLNLFGYMRDFEVAYLMDHWSVLDGHFHEDAIHEIDGGAAPLGTGGRGRVAAFLARHDGALRSAGSAFEPPSAADAAVLEAATARSLVRCYGGAKSQQDVAAALAVCDPGFTIETIAFGITSRDREDTSVQLDAFFGAFPDYGVSLEGFATARGV